MSHLPRRRDRSWLAAPLVFGAGFAIAWRGDGRAPGPAGAPRVAAPRGAERADAVPASPDRLELAGFAALAPTSPTAIRKSELHEWMRFRYDQPRLALASEMAVRWAIDKPVPLREAAKHCAPNTSGAGLAIDLSAHLELAGRDATARGWGCDVEAAPSAVAEACECVLAHLADEVHAIVPETDVRDDELAPYDGMLSIRIWL